MIAALLEVVWAFAIVVGLMVAMAALFYGFCWTVMSLVQFFPLIGRRHRHPHWQQLNSRPNGRRVSS